MACRILASNECATRGGAPRVQKHIRIDGYDVNVGDRTDKMGTGAGLLIRSRGDIGIVTLWMLLLFAVHVEADLVLAEVFIETEAGEQHRFMLEVADTEDERESGLMFREELPADGGMLFQYEEEKLVYMWMKDTPLSLDMVFVRADGQIVHIVPRAEPLSLEPISSRRSALAVIELVGGTCERLNIHAGDRVRHAIFEQADAATSDSSALR